MNAKALTRHYPNLTPEERFRLILAARSRGDEVEEERLEQGCDWIMLRLKDHAPFMYAFRELANATYISLLDEAAGFDALFIDTGDDETNLAQTGEDDNEGAEEEQGEDSARQRKWESIHVAGFLLTAKANGWRLFCDRLTVPPFVELEHYPGFEALQRTLQLAEKVSFHPEGMVRWMNRRRPEGAPEMTEWTFITAETYAAQMETVFRDRVRYWSGEAPNGQG